MTADVSPFLIGLDTTVTQAMRQLEATQERVLFAVEANGRLYGSLTDGDIRRWILNGGSLLATVATVCHRTPYFVEVRHDVAAVKEVMLARNIGCVPVVDGEGCVVELLFWEAVFQDGGSRRPRRPIAVPVVIMAGGRGTRLDPFTRVLPKPLIPVGDKTVIEHIIDSFVAHGVDEFYISVNAKARIIKSYFEELAPPYRLSYVEEEEPRGTAGALAALAGQLSGPVLVTNCDILVRLDYAALLDHHREHADLITIVTSMKSFRIPYGVCEVVDGALARLDEKPEFNFLVSTGLYVLDASTLDLVPAREPYHVTQLIGAVRAAGGRVGVYPVGEDSWLDTGEWPEYRRALQTLNRPIVERRHAER